MQYLANNNFEVIEQPTNAFVKVKPFILGNYTYNNQTYNNLVSVVRDTILIEGQNKHFIDMILTEDIINYNFKFTNPTKLCNNLNITIEFNVLYDLSNTYTLKSVEIGDYTKEYNISDTGINIIKTVFTDYNDGNADGNNVEYSFVNTTYCQLNVNIPSIIFNFEGDYSMVYMYGMIIGVDISSQIVKEYSINSIYADIASVNYMTNNRGYMYVYSNNSQFSCDCDIIKTDNVI